MRLARTLVKAVIVLALAAGALGGAAALGSTLFEEPPRDAEAFAARVAAGSSRDSDGTEPTKAEAAYLRRLVALCASSSVEFEKLRARAERDRTEDVLAAWRPVFVRFDRRFRQLEPPRSLRAEAGRIGELDRASLRLADDALAALRRRDFETFRTKSDAGELLSARLDEAMRRIGAPACARG